MKTETDALRAKLSDLEKGKIFDGDELIIEVDSSAMTTIRNEVGFEGERKYLIRVFHYDLIGSGNHTDITNNGYGEVYEDDEEYPEFRNKLNQAGLWKEE